MDAESSLQRHQKIKEEIARLLARYPLQHTTIEIEQSEESCRDNQGNRIGHD
jgi:hypothetical protein